MSDDRDKKNKDVVDEIQAHLLKENPTTVARLAANLMIDIHRFVNMETLPEEECNCLIARSIKNSQELCDFAKGKRRDSFKLIEEKHDER